MYIELYRGRIANPLSQIPAVFENLQIPSVFERRDLSNPRPSQIPQGFGILTDTLLGE
jgi:hypothetical protein